MAEDKDILQFMVEASKQGVLRSVGESVWEYLTRLSQQAKSSVVQPSKDMDSHIRDIKQMYTDRLVRSGGDSLTASKLVDHPYARFFKEMNELSPESLKKLSEPQIVEIVSTLSKMFNALSESGLTDIQFEGVAKLEDLSDNAQVKNFLLMRDAIKQAVVAADNLLTVQSYGREGYNEAIGHLAAGDIFGSYGLSSVSQEDLDIVSALRMTGIDLKLEPNPKNPSGPYIWTYDPKTPANNFALISKSEAAGDMTFMFSPDEVQSFLDRYLNIQMGPRQNITPDGVLKAFYRMMDARLNEISDKTEATERRSQIFAGDAKKKFTASSMDFKIAKLTDPNQIVKMAQIQTIKDIFQSQIANISISDEFSGEVQSMLDKGGFSKEIQAVLSDLQDQFMESGHVYLIQNQLSKDSSILSQYDELIKSLEGAGESYSTHLASVRQAKELLEANIDFQTQWVREVIPEFNDASSGDFILAVQEAMHSAHMQGGLVLGEDGVYEFMSGGFNLGYDSNALDYVNMKYAARRASAEAAAPERTASASATKPNPVAGATKNSGSSASSAQPMAHIYFPFISALDSNAFGEDVSRRFVEVSEEIGHLDLAKHWFAEGGLLDSQLKGLIKTNPGRTFDEVFQFLIQLHNPAEKPQLFTAECLEEAYIDTHPDSEFAKARKDKYAHAKQIRDAKWNKFLVYLDVAASKLSPEEYKQYNDPSTPQEVRNKLIQGKLQEAITEVDKMPEDQYKKLVENAQKRHHNNLLENVMGNTLAGYIDNPNMTAEQRGKLTPAFEKYLEALQKRQADNDRDLKAKGGTVVGEQPQLTKEEKKPETVKFGKLYPSSPNLEKYKKLMKPFHGKEIVKYFFEPLLAAIDGLEINIDTYNARSTEGGSAVSPEGRDVDDAKPAPESAPEVEEKPAAAPVKIRQRDLEASAFLPAYHILTEKYYEIADSKDSTLAEPLGALCRTLEFLGQADDMSHSPLTQKDTPEKQFRDELRHMMLVICEGNKIKGFGEAQILAHLEDLRNKYGIKEDNSLYKDIKIAFSNMSPVLANVILKLSSKTSVNAGATTMVVGSRLPIEELSKAKSDEERMQIMKKFSDQLKTQGAGIGIDFTTELMGALSLTISDKSMRENYTPGVAAKFAQVSSPEEEAELESGGR